MKKSSLDRRRFLTTGAAASGVWTAAPRILRAQGKVSANDKLNIGVIGSSGQGGFSIGQLKDIANIAALCDVDQNRLAPVARQFPSARTYKDFRKLVEQQDLDAVVVMGGIFNGIQPYSALFSPILHMFFGGKGMGEGG